MVFMEKVISSLQARGFALQIAACPTDLKHLVTLYRFCFGCSFSGVVFVDDQVKGSKQQHLLPFLLSLLYITANATLMLLFLVPFTLIPLHFSPSTPEEPMKLTDFVNIARYNTEFEDIKPLLRLIMQSVFYVFILELAVNNGANLLVGGRLVGELAALASRLQPCKEGERSSSRLAKSHQWTIGRIVALKLATVACLTAVSLLLFNRPRLALLFQQILTRPEGQQQPLTIGQRNELLKMTFLTCWHLGDYLTHLMWPVFFLYTMNLFSLHIRHIRESVEEGGEGGSLSESRLEAIVEQLTDLSVTFRRILAYFSLPLSTILTLSVLSLIGSCCFLSQSNGGGGSGQSQPKYYVSTIFSFGVYALLRLLLIAAASSLPDGELRELIRVVHRRSPTTASGDAQLWTASGWLTFGQLRSLRGRFSVTFLDEALSVSQSTVLALLGFALQYTVVLLQTNDYQAGGGGGGRNATLA